MPRNNQTLCAILYLSASLTVMAGAAIAPALPAMEEHFRESPNLSMRLSLMVTIPALCTAIAAPLGGWIGDRTGRSLALVAALWLYAISGAAGLLLSGIDQILATRALMGIAVALIMTSALGLVGDLFAGDQRRTVLGRQAAWTAIGGIFFPLIGGLCADISWRGAFLPFLVAAPLAIWARATLPREPAQRTAQLSAKVGLAILRPVFAPYLIAILGMALFNVFPMKIGLHLAGKEGLLPEGLGTGLATGIALGWLSACAAITSSLFGAVYTRIGRRVCLSTFLVLFGVGYLGIGIASGVVLLLLAVTIAGLGLGLLMPLVSHWVLDAAPETTRGALLGGLSTAVFAGQFSAQFFADPTAASLGSAGLFIALGAAAIGAGAAVLLTNRR